MIRVVRVNLTIVATVPAAWLNAKPAATTAEVSFTAVPAQTPKPLSLRPIRCPRAGKVNTATMLKKNTTVTE